MLLHVGFIQVPCEPFGEPSCVPSCEEKDSVEPSPENLGSPKGSHEHSYESDNQVNIHYCAADMSSEQRALFGSPLRLGHRNSEGNLDVHYG